MSVTLDEIIRSVRSSLITSVGLGVLLVQTAQVRRRELGRACGTLVREASDSLGERVKLVGGTDSRNN